MRKPRAAVLLSLAIVLVIAVPGLARRDVAEMTTAGLINEAYSAREIDHTEMILLKAYAVYASDRLPPEYVGGVNGKCGVPFIDEIERALLELPEEVANEIRGLRDRPTCMTYIDTEHFRIHYDTSGGHRILGWPNTAYRDALAVAAEYCWEQEIDVLGFRAPPSDGDDPDGGDGGPLYDIYVQHLTGVLGYCQGCYYVPSTPQNDATSFVVVENDFAGYASPHNMMKVTTAHEFNHACQNAHDANESVWYKECSSMWAEDTVYDSINDYRNYIPYFFNQPYYSLDYDDPSGMRIYASCVWNFFLSERYDLDLIPEIWYQCENSGQTYTAMNLTLVARGSTLADEMEEFAIWNWFTNWRDDHTHYDEGSYWPLAHTTKYISSYPVTDVTTFELWRPDHMATNYVQFNNPGSGQTDLHIFYDGPATISIPNAAFINRRNNSAQTTEYGGITLNPWGNGEITCSGWDETEYFTLVVVNKTTGQENMLFSFDAEQVDTGISDETHVFGLKPASPNPFTVSTSIAYTVPTSGGLVEVTIYDVAGREIRHLVNERMPGGDGVAVWDGLDNGGRPVASGVYFARLDVDGLTASGKLMMLK